MRCNFQALPILGKSDEDQAWCLLKSNYSYICARFKADQALVGEKLKTHGSSHICKMYLKMGLVQRNVGMLLHNVGKNA